MPLVKFTPGLGSLWALMRRSVSVNHTYTDNLEFYT